MQSLNELHVGRFLGRYELLMPVAQGGMASVWAARLKGTRGFQRVVAIKTILPSLSDDARFEQMFLDEAALAARIRHPNVVQVLDLGEEGGLLYQVMEWIDGEPLSAFLRELPEGSGLPYPIAARIMIGACDGLHAAHETRDDADESVGLVHRDMSPQNILVTRDGVPKVVDFGVAKATSLSSAQTGTGTLKGKPGYMAPEQIQGEDVDRRADVFALGVLLYMMTTSRHPFRGKNDMATLHNIVSAEGAELPSALTEGYPETLEQVVMMAVSKDREQRFASTAAMARALEAAVPDVHKVGDAEVASFTRTLLAEKLEARANALRKALADADQRASLVPEPRLSHRPVRSPSTLQGIGGPTPPPRAPAAPAAPAAEVQPAEPSSESGITRPEGSTFAAVEGTPIPARKSSSAIWFVLAGGVAVLMLAVVAVAVGVLVVRPRMATKPTPVTVSTSVETPPSDVASDVPDVGPDTPETPDAAGEGTTDISADSLPTAQDPVTPPPSRTVKDPVPTTSATAPPTAAPPTGTGPATTTTPAVPGTVPKIRDPGF